MPTLYITMLVGAVVIVALVVYVQNRLGKLRKAVEQNWQPVQRHCEARHHIIRNIADAAEPFIGANDPNTIDDVFSLLDTLAGDLSVDQHVEFENRLTQASRRLLQVGDGNYDLRGDGKYWDQKRHLAEQDLLVTQSARFYNVSAKEYNEAVNSPPCALIAGYLGFGKQPYLATSAAESETPQR